MNEILAMKHITKTYPGVKALDDVSVSFIQGEVHAVMGENGAGKSTLMKVLNGMISSDNGEIWFEGKPVAIRNPRDARALGIAMIHQELNPIKDLTVAENMFVGRYPQVGCFVDWKTVYDRCRALFQHWNVDFDPKMKVRFLSTAETQMLEILKAISYDAKLIIMDEPTSALTEREVQKLFSFIEELKSRQITIIMITHKIDEVFQIADRVSVLRDGKYIGTKDIQDLDHDKLISMMVGREISNVHPPRNYQGGETVLQVQHLKCGKKVKDVSFAVHKGEILGFAGIVGAGRTESLRCVFGLDRAEGGTISMEGREVKINCPRDAMKNGIAMVTENRKEDGLVLCRSIMENTVLPSTYMNAKHGILRKRSESKTATEICTKLRVKTPSYEKIVNQLNTVVNDGSVSIGFIVHFKAKDTVVGPELLKVTTQEVIKLSSLTMEVGDELIVSTMTNDCYCRLVREGEEQNVFYNMDFESTFFQLDIGENYIRFDADSGVKNLEVSIDYAITYAGV